MQWQLSSSANDGGKRVTPVPVRTPRQDQGVGEALRSAYLPRSSDMPNDFRNLLDKLH